LHYEARLRYARSVLPTQPLDRGFYVEKTMRAVTAESLASAAQTVPTGASTVPSLKGGSLVLIDLRVVAPQPQDYVVVDDPIPAGLEAVDAQLATTARSLDVEDPDEAPEFGGLDWWPPPPRRRDWDHQELRDDRALFFVDRMEPGMVHFRYLARATTVGKFVMPPTKVESMYQPEVFGRTGAVVVEVRE